MTWLTRDAARVNCPWNSRVNVCCFDGRVSHCRRVQTEKRIIPTCCTYSKHRSSPPLDAPAINSMNLRCFTNYESVKPTTALTFFITQCTKSALYHGALMVVWQTALCCCVQGWNTPSGTFAQLKAICQSVDAPSITGQSVVIYLFAVSASPRLLPIVIGHRGGLFVPSTCQQRELWLKEREEKIKQSGFWFYTF